MAKYSKGTCIVIKEDVSENGKYADYAGMHGKVTEKGYGWSGSSVDKVKLDNGTELTNVGTTVLKLEEEYEENHPDTREDIEDKIEKYQNRIERLQEKIDDLNSRLEFMDEYDLDEYDDRYHKADQMLKEMDSDKDHSDKVKAIANLL